MTNEHYLILYSSSVGAKRHLSPLSDTKTWLYATRKEAEEAAEQYVELFGMPNFGTWKVMLCGKRLHNRIVSPCEQRPNFYEMLEMRQRGER